MNDNVTTLNWDFSFSEWPNQNNPETCFSRQELKSQLQNTTELCIERVASAYKLSGSITNSIYDKMSQFETALIAGCEGEYSKTPQEELNIGAIVEKLGNVALLPHATFGDLFPREKIIYLSVNSANEEARALDSALKVVVPIYKENTRMVSPNTMNTLEVLSENPRELMKTAIALAYGRRLLKYGLLRDEDMPAGMIEGLGFDEWLGHCKEKQGRKSNFNRNDKKMLRSIYKKENMATKNTRLSLWTPMFYSIIKVAPEQDPFLYVKYAQNVDDDSQYSVTFNYGGTTCRLDDDDIRSTLNKIFVPSDTKMTVIDNESVE